MTGNTKDKIISELDKIQQEVTEHIEESRDRLDGMDRDVRRFESTLLVEMGDCKRSGDGLEKRLSKLEGLCGRLDGAFDSIHKIKEGTVPQCGALFVFIDCSDCSHLACDKDGHWELDNRSDQLSWVTFNTTI